MFNGLNAQIAQLNAALSAVNNLFQPPNLYQPLNAGFLGGGPFGGNPVGGGLLGEGAFNFGNPVGGGLFGQGAFNVPNPVGGGLFGQGALNVPNLFNGPQEGAIGAVPQNNLAFMGNNLLGVTPAWSIGQTAAGGDNSSNWGFGTGAPPAVGHRQAGLPLRRPNWEQSPMRHIRKNLYDEHLETARRSNDEVVAFRDANAIKVLGIGVPKPILSIEEAGFPDDLREILQAMKCSSPSRLQAQCWPVALSGRDLAIVQADPEGKILGYLLPAIVHIRNQQPIQRSEGPIALVLTPTRESLRRIEQAVRDIERYAKLRAMSLSSGVPKEPQLKQLEEGAEMCIANPGRLVAFVEDCKVNLRRCSYLVVDGADRMVAMGFHQQLRTIAENIRPDRQTIMCISSLSVDMERLAEEIFTDHITVTIGACQNQPVLHVVVVCDEDDKEHALIGLLQDIIGEKGVKVIVFVQMRQAVDELVVMMLDHGWPAVGIHNQKTEEERDWALKAFRLRSVPILVTTDVEACGLEADGVRFVVNYDRPASVENYSLRVKHASRADGTGRAYTFIAPSDSFCAQMMISILREANQDIPREVFSIAMRKAPSGSSRAH